MKQKFTQISLSILLLLFSIAEIEAQCTGSGSGGSSSYISSVWWPTSGNAFANQTNSGGGSYTDYTGSGSKRNLQPGDPYPDNAYNFAYPWNGTGTPIYYHVYLDLNRDGDFDDTGEKVASGNSPNSMSASSSFSGRFNLTAANPGTARVRFMVKYGSDITGPCETGFNGEVEDWLVTLPFINSAPAITAPDFLLSKSDSSVTLNNGSDFEISVYDVNSSQTQTVSITVSGGGNFTLSGTSGISFSTGDGTADANMVFSGSLNDINAALNGASFDPNSTVGQHTISVSTNDGNSGTDSESFIALVSESSFSPKIVQQGNFPIAATQDASGNTYVIEFDGSTFDVFRYPKGNLTGSLIYNANFAFNGGTGEVPTDIEVDQNGDIYVITHRTGGSGSNGEILKLDASSSWSVSSVASGKQYTAIAIDANNDLFACQLDAGNGEYDILKYTGGSGSGTTIYNGLSYGSGSYPWGLDFDSNNHLYVLNSFNTSNGQILKLSSPSYSSASVVASGGKYTGLAVSGEDVFVFEENSGGTAYDVVKYTSGSGSGSLVWSNVGKSGSFLPVGLGSYRGSGNIVVPDPWTTNSVILLSGAAPVATCSMTASITSQTNVSCNGNSTGSLTASPASGASPYSYSWSNGATSATASGLAAGTYTVTITDNNACTATASSTITQPTVLSASTGSTMNVTCNGGSNGSVSSNATGGLTPYTYAWSNGATTSSVTGISAGTYTVTVTDDNGCTSTASTTITEPTALTASTTLDKNVSCSGGSDGELTGSGSGGSNPYLYSWSNGGTTASQVSLPAGTYTVTITDNNGCTATSSKTITSPAALDAGEIQ